ncbi:MAG: hypothetical protein AAGU15_02680 [Anaerolineaceae bacterium]|jgi:hypothetical protein
MQTVLSSLKINSFFIFASLLTYMVGAIFAGFERNHIDSLGLVLGLLVFLIILALQQLFNYLTTSKINPYTRVNFERGNKKGQLFILTGVFFLIYFFLIFSILSLNLLIGVNLIYITLITILMLMTIFRIGKLISLTYGVIIEGMIVSPLMLLFGTGMQGMNPTSGHVLLTLSFFFLYVSIGTSLLFEIYERDLKGRERSLLDIIGWEHAVRLQNISLVLAYLVFFIYFYRNGSLGPNLTVLLTAVIGIFSMFLLNRMVRGMKPQWQIITATAYLHFFAVCYLLVIPLI